MEPKKALKNTKNSYFGGSKPSTFEPNKFEQKVTPPQLYPTYISYDHTKFAVDLSNAPELIAWRVDQISLKKYFLLELAF